MYDWCRKYVGIPFVSGGRDFTGCDCYGLVRLVLKEEYGISLPLLNSDYTNALSVAETKRLFFENVPLLCGERIKEPEEKAVALMNMCGRLCHVGLYAGEGYIIHSRHKVGVVCERLSSPQLAGRVEGLYRVNQSNCISESVLVGKN